MRVQDRKTAWLVARRFFATDIRMSQTDSRIKGVPVYVSTSSLKKYRDCAISDMGDRLVVDRHGASFVIHIRDEEHQAASGEKTVEVILDEWDKARAEAALAENLIPDSDMCEAARQRFIVLDSLVRRLRTEAGMELQN